MEQYYKGKYTLDEVAIVQKSQNKSYVYYFTRLTILCCFDDLSSSSFHFCY